MMPPTVTDHAPPSPAIPSAVASSPDALLLQCLEMVAEDLIDVDEALRDLLHSSVAVIPQVGEHLAFAGGKRFRPLLTLLCARAANYFSPERITIAAVGELLHTATLLHDDVIDEGEFRRGRPASRMQFGNGLAVLTGDYCLARALQAVSRTGRIGAVQSMSDTVTKMAEGEVAQLHAAGDATIDERRYHDIIDRKTAALIAWCSAVAGLVDERYRAPLTTFGRELGHAFQIADDVLDYVADAELTGKARGQDLREGKMTLPLILACTEDPALHHRVTALLTGGPPVDEREADALLGAIIDGGAPHRANALAEQHAARAVAALQPLPSSDAKDALAAVARFTVRRRQ